MKNNLVKIVVITVVFITLLSLTGCVFTNVITGSGNLQTKEFSFSGFNKIDVGSVFEANITRSDSYQVSVTIDDNLVNYLDVTQSGDTVHIALKPFVSFGFPFHASANITMPELQACSISGASKGTVTGFDNDNMEYNVSGASALTVADLKAKNATINLSGFSTLSGTLTTSSATIEVSGASTLNLAGSAQNAQMEATGASSLRTANFITQDASVVLSGASNGSVMVNGKLDLDISGASRLTYADSPTLGSIKVSGASTLSRQ